jgi:hypothetical protein
MSAQVVPFSTQPAPQAINLQDLLATTATLPSCAAVQPTSRLQLAGGVYSPDAALELMNSWFLVSERDGEVGIYRIEDDGALTYLAPEHFKLLLANLLVDVSLLNQHSNRKLIGIDVFWLRHPQRRTCRKIVFEPSGQVGQDEYNLWRGFAVGRKRGFQKQRSLLRHIRRIICGGDKVKFKYLIRWLSWAVQNPHRPAEVVLVLISNTEGSGKSTLGKVMLTIFGQRHGLLVDDTAQLLGQFNSHLETACFVCGEEVPWAGDPRIADALRSRITASTIPIDEKYRQRRQVPNRLHVLFTTNHTWAISAGVQARRYFVVEVSDEVAQDRSYFDALYRDLEAGGIEEFLDLLLRLNLGAWHPRQVPKTDELVEQQVLSAGSVEQWLLACADLDTIAIGTRTPCSSTSSLGSEIATQTLYDAYCEYANRRHGARIESLTVFGRLLTKMLGPSRRLPAAQSSGRRPPGYFVLDADALRNAVHTYLKTGK